MKLYNVILNHPKLKDTNVDGWIVFEQSKLDQSKINFYPLSVFLAECDFEEFMQFKKTKLYMVARQHNFSFSIETDPCFHQILVGMDYLQIR